MNRINATRFMTQEELMEQLVEIDLQSTENCGEGGIPLLVKDKKVYVDTGDNHTIIFGATGSKKTRLLGMPAVDILSRAGESFMVTDPKGEIYERTVDDVVAREYQVFCINLRDFKKGVTWNPLSLPYDYYHNGEKSKAVELVSEIAKMLAGEGFQDPYWSETAADVIAGLMMILLESAIREECNIKSVLSLWEQYQSDKEGMLRMVKSHYGESMIARKLSSLNNESGKTVGSIEAVVATGLNRLIANEEFVEFLSQEGMEFDDVVKKKTAIYLIIPDENKFYHFMASLFMEQLYEVLIKEAQKNAECRLAIRMNYIVDEFANIPKIRNMDSMITAARSRNIRFNLIVQSKMQLEDKYGNVASVICDNCNNWVYLYSKDYGLLNEISNLCGEVIYDNHMTIPLISEFELQHLKKEEGEALVLAGRNFPCIVNLADINDYPRISSQRLAREEQNGQEWIVADTFLLKKEKSRNTYAYFPCGLERRKTMHELMYKNIWLVGACNGVIMVEDRITRQELDSGKGMLKLCLNQFTYLEDALQLDWYTAQGDERTYYQTRLKRQEPEKVFLTIEECGAKNFSPVSNEILKKALEVGIC